MSIVPDVDMVSGAFVSQFNTVYSKCYYMSTKVLCFLFCTYKASFYGAETWYSALRQIDFFKIGVAYHRAVKKTVGLEKLG